MNIFGRHTETKVQEPVQQTPRPEQVATPPVRNFKMLNATQLQRTKETKRLAETKLSNLEESLKNLQKQQEWLRRHNELRMALSQEKAKLFSLNKKLASMNAEILELKRYETFESIQGTYQRMTLLSTITSQNKRAISSLEHDKEELQRKWDEQEKLLQQKEELCKNAGKRLFDIHDHVFTGFRLIGEYETVEEEAEFLQSILENKKQIRDVLEKNIKEQEEEVSLLAQELERHRAGRQSMEMHETMLVHGEAILLRLEYLQEVETQQKQLRERQKAATRRQNEENEQLGHVFSQYQNLLADISMLEDELLTHKTSIQGQDSYKLQERAMKLKSRIQMLESAQSLWKRISTGYNIIDEKQKLLNNLRLHIEQTERNVHILEAEAGKTSRLCHEKEYTYLLSKGQNIIQLRADLKEGVSCSVCGATHHPYHSDTMLEQSKLIGDFKTEYELLAQEERNKLNQLEDLKLDLAESKGRQIAEEAALNSFRIRQQEDVNEWRIYASLDRQFQECSPSTNMEARTAVLRQLKENTARDAETAQKELDAFNFHQSRITETSDKLQALEQKKNELNTRLNELNTGCQVMAGQVDRLQSLLDNEDTKYSQTYEQLEKAITIKDWLGAWNQNHESIRGQIKKLMAAWDTVNERIGKEQVELAQERMKLEFLRETLQAHLQTIDDIENRIEKCQTLLSENRKNMEQAVGSSTPKQVFHDAQQHYDEALHAERVEAERSVALRQSRDRALGRTDFHLQYGEELAERLVAERSALDLWMHRYNAQNPPVQYQELEKVFMDDRDWNDSRQEIRQVQMEAALTQARVDDLNSRFIALQAEGMHRNLNEEELQESLATQQESLESKRRDIMMQIAKATVALEEHEKAIHTANNALPEDAAQEQQ